MKNWIKTTARMPKPGKKVLFYGKHSMHREPKYAIFMGNYDKSLNKFLEFGSFEIVSVTHWMNLPDKP